MLLYCCILLLVGVQYNRANLCQNQSQADSSSLTASNPPQPCFDLTSYQYMIDRKATQGTELVLECYVSHRSGYSVAWSRNKHFLTLNDKVIAPSSTHIRVDSDGERRFNLVVDELDTAKHSGIYECAIVTDSYPTLVYRVDVLMPPQITRIPAQDQIFIEEGGSLLVQCLTTGNPKPELTYSKHHGDKGKHTAIDVSNSSMQLTNVDQSYAGLYSCTATNGVGIPVTSEFQIFIKFKPRVKYNEEMNIYQNVMYTTTGKLEQIKCIIDGYPRPVMSLLKNGLPVSEQSYTFEKNQDVKDQYILAFNLVGSSETFGLYECIAKNDLGTTVAELKVTPRISWIKMSLADKHLIYSDVIVYEWSLYSGSSLTEFNIQVFAENGTIIMNEIRRAKPISLSLLISENEDSTNESVSSSSATFHNENQISYKGYLDVVKLAANSTYTVRLRIKNQFGEWSEWSQNITAKTSSSGKPHRGSYVIHHHYRNLMHAHLENQKHKHYQIAPIGNSRDLNGGKRDKYNADMFENSALTTTLFSLYRSSFFLTIFLFSFKI